MPNTRCVKHNKLSKTMGSPLDSMEKIISSQCPIIFDHVEVFGSICGNSQFSGTSSASNLSLWLPQWQ